MKVGPLLSFLLPFREVPGENRHLVTVKWREGREGGREGGNENKRLLKVFKSVVLCS